MKTNAENSFDIIYTYAERFDEVMTLAKANGTGDHLPAKYFNQMENDIYALYGKELQNYDACKDQCVQKIAMADYDLDMEKLLNGLDAAAKYQRQLVIWRYGLLVTLIAMCTDDLDPEQTVVLAQAANALAGESEISWVNGPERKIVTDVLEHGTGLNGEEMTGYCRMLLCTPEITGTAKAHTAPYEHPVDKKIIGALDNPATNAALSAVVEVSAATGYGSLIASSIPVSEKNFPEINAIVDECVNTLNIRRPHVVVSMEGGLNAYTFGSDSEPYIVLTHLLVTKMTPDMLRFVIGHECGHIAMGHVAYHVAAELLLNAGTGLVQEKSADLCVLLAKVSNLSLSAWNRRSEITADRAGLLCCKNLDTATLALVKLQSGSVEADQVDIEDYLMTSEAYLKGSCLRRVPELLASHPMIPKRIRALKLFADSSCYHIMAGKQIEQDLVDKKTLEEEVEKIIAVI